MAVNTTATIRKEIELLEKQLDNLNKVLLPFVTDTIDKVATLKTKVEGFEKEIDKLRKTTDAGTISIAMNDIKNEIKNLTKQVQDVVSNCQRYRNKAKEKAKETEIRQREDSVTLSKRIFDIFKVVLLVALTAYATWLISK